MLPDLAKVAKKRYQIWQKFTKKCYQIGAKSHQVAQVDQSKNVTVRTYHKLSRDKNGPKNGQKVLKNAKKSQNTFHLISTVSKLLTEVEP